MFIHYSLIVHKNCFDIFSRQFVYFVVVVVIVQAMAVAGIGPDGQPRHIKTPQASPYSTMAPNQAQGLYT